MLFQVDLDDISFMAGSLKKDLNTLKMKAVVVSSKLNYVEILLNDVLEITADYKQFDLFD